LAYWFHCDYKKDNRWINEPELDWYFTKQKDGKKRANISRLQKSDKVIFVKGLLAYADGEIEKINLEDGNYPDNGEIYPYKVEYSGITPWNKKVPLFSYGVKKFLANVPFSKSKHGTFLKSENISQEDLTLRLRGTIQRINKEIFEEIKNRGQ